MHCKVLNWTHWIAENTKVGQTPAIIHRFLLHQVISCNDCNAYVNQDDDTRNHNREYHMAECDWCVGDWWNHTRFSPPSQPRPKEGHTDYCYPPLFWKYDSLKVQKCESVKVWNVSSLIAANTISTNTTILLLFFENLRVWKCERFSSPSHLPQKRSYWLPLSPSSSSRRLKQTNRRFTIH